MFRKGTNSVVSFFSLSLHANLGLESSFLLRRNKKHPCGSFLLPGGSERMRGCRYRSMRTLGSNPCFFFEEIKNTLTGLFYFLAEARGFEPPIHCCIHAFQACSFNHSDTLPSGMIITDIKYFYQI